MRPDMISLMEQEGLFLPLTGFPVGIKVTSFLLSGFIIAIRKLLFCLQLI